MKDEKEILEKTYNETLEIITLLEVDEIYFRELLSQAYKTEDIAHFSKALTDTREVLRYKKVLLKSIIKRYLRDKEPEKLLE